METQLSSAVAMTVSIDSDGCLSGIDGWEGGNCERLSGGLTNETWKVSLDGRSGVLKLDELVRSQPFNSRHDEASVQGIAAAHGLAPKVLYVDDTTYFTEYVDGETWQKACLEKPRNLERLAAVLRRLHALPLTGRSFDSTAAARRYDSQIDSADTALVAAAIQIVECRRLPQNLCCCHNDLVAENFISTPELMLLDWEYACDNDPFFDLATVVEHHQLSIEQVERLLNAYFDGDGMRWFDHLQSMQQLYLALLWLWMAARPDTDDDELADVGGRLTSCF